MRISELARRTGVSARAIRLYEARGLLAAARTDAGYRQFDDADVRVLVFIRMARALGLSLAQIGEWVPAYRSGRLRYGQLIDGLQQRLDDIDRDIARLQDLRQRTTDHITWARDRQGEAHRVAAKRAAPGAKAAQPPWPTVAPQAAAPSGTATRAGRQRGGATGRPADPGAIPPSSPPHRPRR
jgi:MerR family copper efflux transcriptional regulator